MPCPAASLDKCVLAEDAVHLAMHTTKCVPSYRNKMVIISGTSTTQVLAETLEKRFSSFDSHCFLHVPPVSPSVSCCLVRR